MAEPSRPNSLADHLFEARTARGLTQTTVARRAGLSVRTIRNLEQGRVARPRVRTVSRLCDVLDLADDERAVLLAFADPEPCRPSLSGPQAETPRQLPAGPEVFVGRAAELDRLVALLDPERKAADRPAVVAIAGAAGTGKTALALEVARRLGDRYPDGHLFARLGGTSPDRPSGSQVVDRMLRGFGRSGHQDQTPDERAAVARTSLTAGRFLLLLDDAATEEQVRPLLPGEPGSAVLITGRTKLTTLDGVRTLDLSPMTPRESVDLLRSLAGLDRTADASSDGYAVAVDYCECMPAAIRIAASKLAARPHWSLRHLASYLADGRHRLSRLSEGDLNIRDSIAASVRSLDDWDRAVFHVLDLLDDEISPSSVGALTGYGTARAEEHLDALAAARLLEAVPGAPSGRYRPVGLVGLFLADQRETVG